MPKVNAIYFPDIIPDNESLYFSYFFGILDSVDELCSIEVVKHPSSITFRIAPSHPKYSEIILKEVLTFHNIFKIHLDLSKSIKSSGGTISFEITI